MLVLLAVIVLIGAALELYAFLDGVKHIAFSCKPELPQTEPGDTVQVRAEMTNTGRFPISYVKASISCPAAAQFPEGITPVKDQFFQTVDTSFRLWGRQRVIKTIPVKFEKRGIHFFKGAVIQRGDLLGLHHVTDNYEEQTSILVFPKSLEDQDMRSAMGAYCGEMIAKRHLLRDPVLQLGVREYTGTEPMKTISWTQTARRGQLMVREFDFTRDMSCMVLFATDGLRPGREDILDNCCSMVRTVCEELTARNVNIEFYTNGSLYNLGNNKNGIWSCSASSADMTDLLRTLALMYVAPARQSGQQMAVTAARASGRDTAFVVVAPAETDSVRQMIRILQEESGMDVLLLLESEYAQCRQKGQ